MQQPQRKLTPKLTEYYTKNLIVPSAYAEDFDISYDDIKNDIDNVERKKIKTARKKQSNQSKEIKMEFDNDLDYNNEYNEVKSNNKRKSNSKNVQINKQLNNTANNNSLLTKIDQNFRPTILLSTKTYTRGKLIN